MEWKLDRSSLTPIYRQIIEYVKYRISNGEYPPGSLLPSERALAKELGVNRSTVVTAYEELRASGLVTSKKGSGTRVSLFGQEAGYNQLPDWDQYVIGGSLLPNVPLMRRIFKEARNEKVIDLATGELSPDLFPRAQVEERMRTANFTFQSGYEHQQGNLQLRETIASQLKRDRNIDTASSSVLITSGAQQALYLIIQCLLKPGDTVVIEDPSYCYSLPLFKSMGIKTCLLTADKHGINPDDIVAFHQKNNIRMIFLNPTFQNPTGISLHPKRRKKLLEIAVEYGIPIIEDDPYTLTAFDTEAPPTLKSMDDYGVVLYISSLSKIVSSGLRIGWIVGPQPVISRLADVKQQIDFGQSIFSQWMANEVLTSPNFDEHIQELGLTLHRRRDMMIQALSKYLPNEVEFSVPKGGIHLWCKVKKHVSEGRLLEQAIDNGMIFMPGSALGSTEGYVRFTFGRTDETYIEEAIVRFARALLWKGIDNV